MKTPAQISHWMELEIEVSQKVIEQLAENLTKILDPISVLSSSQLHFLAAGRVHEYASLLARLGTASGLLREAQRRHGQLVEFRSIDPVKVACAEARATALWDLINFVRNSQ